MGYTEKVEQLTEEKREQRMRGQHQLGPQAYNGHRGHQQREKPGFP